MCGLDQECFTRLGECVQDQPATMAFLMFPQICELMDRDLSRCLLGSAEGGYRVRLW